MNCGADIASPPVTPLIPSDLSPALDYLRSGAKPPTAWAVGLEMELLGYEAQTRQRVTSEQVQTIVRELAGSDERLEREGETIVEAHLADGRLTLEPGGQIEFSSHPWGTLAMAARAIDGFLTRLRVVADEYHLMFCGIGFDPLRRLDEQHWIVKGRYRIMKPYLGSRGRLAHDMMTRTAALQASIDFSDEADLGKKYSLGNRLGPIVAAMFANSPFADGTLSGAKSTRYAVWLETDPDRTGVASAALAPFTLERFVARALETPTIFVVRDGAIREGGRPLLDMPDPSVSDFVDLLSTIFTEARLRPGYVEMRSADSGNAAAALSLMALWKGLTYDAATLDCALALAPRLSAEEFIDLQRDVARRALGADGHGVHVLELARDIAELAADGLAHIAPDEVRLLDELRQRLEFRVSPADILIKDSRGDGRRALDRTRVA